LSGGVALLSVTHSLKHCTRINGISQTLTGAFAQILNNMVDLDRFDLDGVTMRINRLETQGKQLLFSGYAQIERIPGNMKGIRTGDKGTRELKGQGDNPYPSSPCPPSLPNPLLSSNSHQ